MLVGGADGEALVLRLAIAGGVVLTLCAVEADRFIPDGRDAFRAFKYRPQALQMVFPAGERRQRGVLVVPQLL